MKITELTGNFIVQRNTDKKLKIADPTSGITATIDKTKNPNAVKYDSKNKMATINTKAGSKLGKSEIKRGTKVKFGNENK